MWGEKADKVIKSIISLQKEHDRTTIVAVAGVHVSTFKKNDEIYLDAHEDSIIVVI